MRHSSGSGIKKIANEIDDSEILTLKCLLNHWDDDDLSCFQVPERERERERWMYPNISVTFQFTWSKSFFCYWDSIEHLQENPCLKIIRLCCWILSQQSFPEIPIPFFLYTEKAAIITGDHVFKKCHWLRFPSTNMSRQKSLNKHILYLDIISLQSVFLERHEFFLEMYEMYSIRR